MSLISPLKFLRLHSFSLCSNPFCFKTLRFNFECFLSVRTSMILICTRDTMPDFLSAVWVESNSIHAFYVGFGAKPCKINLLNVWIFLWQLAVRKCNECGQPLPENFEPPGDEPWTTGIFGCTEDTESCKLIYTL